jgi:hypothetical protein
MVGITAARGKYIIMGDSDDSYDFSKSSTIFIGKAAREGYDLVMGTIVSRAALSRALDATFASLSWKSSAHPAIGRLFFSKSLWRPSIAACVVSLKNAITRLDLRTTGMEFASEMVVKATLHKTSYRRSPNHSVAGRTKQSTALANMA